MLLFSRFLPFITHEKLPHQFLRFLRLQKLVAYLKYMTTVVTLLGGNGAKITEQMRDVLKFEMKMAKVCQHCEIISWPVFVLKFNLSSASGIQKQKFG